MKIYFACPTGDRRNKIVKEHGDKFGACLTRDVFNNITANMMPWFFDNGAFSDWKNDRAFNHQKFADKMLEIEFKIRFGYIPPPDFVVVPDIVGEGTKSLERSVQWMDYLENNFPHNKYYLAIQDGMSFFMVESLIKKRLFDGLFVGGTKPWKYRDGAKWVRLAQKYGLPIHCGGVGTRKNLLWAKDAGFDSSDSGLAMIHPRHLKDVLNIDKEMLWSA